MERSLKEAGSELKARLEAGRERRFPLMGVKGAANALMLRQAVIELARPIIAITSLASEAEALAGELAFFLDQPAKPSASLASEVIAIIGRASSITACRSISAFAAPLTPISGKRRSRPASNRALSSLPASFRLRSRSSKTPLSK